MDGENRRSKEAVRNSIRTYGVKVMDPSSLPLKKTKQTESQESVSRFSERSLHSQYEMEKGCKEDCDKCLSRVPYGSIIGFIFCILGILFVAIADQRASALTKDMIHDVLKKSDSATTYYIILLFLVLLTAADAILVLILGILTTGDTRDRVYKVWKARLGGTVAAIVLLCVTSVLLFFWWLTFLGFCCILTILMASRTECDIHKSWPIDRPCLEVSFFNLLLDGKNILRVCDGQYIKKFCKDFVEKSGPSFFVIGLGITLVLIGLVIFLVCLSANYTRIRSQAKMEDGGTRY